MREGGAWEGEAAYGVVFCEKLLDKGWELGKSGKMRGKVPEDRVGMDCTQ